MYYAVFLIFVTLAVFFIMPVVNSPKKDEKENQKFDTTEVDYIPAKRERPQRTQGSSSRIKDEDVTNQR